MKTNEIHEYCTDIDGWPSSWQIDTPDIEIGKMIVSEIFVPFIQSLISESLSKRTIKRHIDNIWLLGGEIIGRTNFDESLRDLDSHSLVADHIDEFGGPYSKHLDTKNAINSFNTTCKRLNKFLEKSQNNA